MWCLFLVRLLFAQSVFEIHPCCCLNSMVLFTVSVPLCEYTMTAFIQFPIHGHCGGFQFEAVKNKASVNAYKLPCVWTYKFSFLLVK